MECPAGRRGTAGRGGPVDQSMNCILTGRGISRLICGRHDLVHGNAVVSVLHVHHMLSDDAAPNCRGAFVLRWRGGSHWRGRVTRGRRGRGASGKQRGHDAGRARRSTVAGKGRLL